MVGVMSPDCITVEVFQFVDVGGNDNVLAVHQQLEETPVKSGGQLRIAQDVEWPFALQDVFAVKYDWFVGVGVEDPLF